LGGSSAATKSKDIAWPKLSFEELARLREMSFQVEALETELIATKSIRLMVEAEPDPIVRDAIAMQAYEKEPSCRTASRIKHYAIAVPNRNGYSARSRVGIHVDGIW